LISDENSLRFVPGIGSSVPKQEYYASKVQSRLVGSMMKDAPTTRQ